MAAGRVIAKRRYGFRIEQYLELHRWRVLELDGATPMTMVAECPADIVPLKTLCVFTSDRQAIRLGCCPQCGHVTYIDRPTKGWIDSFYRDTWDSAPDRATEHGSALALRKLAHADASKEKSTVRFARELPLDRSLPVCEIGCGFGTSLRQLAQAGFTRLLGIEASQHRAAIARSDGFDVLTTPFEAPETRDALRSCGPFAIIYSFHALEHTYQPEAVLNTAAELQEPGGYLIISVPHQQGEPTMGVLMFLPHLHSFTAVSLARLAARCGYEVVDTRLSGAKNLNVLFRRTLTPPSIAAEEGAYDAAVDKVISGLDLHRTHVGRRRLWWSRRSDQGGQVWAGPPEVAGHWNWERFVRRTGVDRPRSVLVSNPGKVGCSAEDVPVEIQFSGSIGLFVK